MQVKLVNFRKYESGNLKGFGTVSLEDGDTSITLNDIRLMVKKGDTGEYFFVGFPSSKYTDKDGIEKYNSYIKVDKILFKKITEVLATAYNKGESVKVTETKTVNNKIDDDLDLPF